ncbi:Epi-inositol hydrolase [Klebsiella pneumoniae]|uniref:Epi-inositol hydrolase n=1 Tax=Klebsiella pneumoniae TaxID=573 RepID=A0A377USM1_KLEPN|nr:Epi-inositol hydrolase [Klebsiella pneumoniae]
MNDGPGASARRHTQILNNKDCASWGKLRLTTAQALVKFLDNQYLEVDGVELKFVKGIFAIFGHGNVLGLGQALEQDSGDMRVYQGRNEQGMAPRGHRFCPPGPAPADYRLHLLHRSGRRPT